MAANDESPPSSPDPLAISIDDAPSATRYKPKRPTSTPRKPLGALNGNVRLQDFYLATPPALSAHSPTKSTAQTEDLLSPWRIRVTVEAEREEGDIVGKATSRPLRLAEKSTTTTVPLKPANDSSPAQAKRGRGRPRKSSTSPRKRNGTPKPRRPDQHAVHDVSLSAEKTPPRAGKGRRPIDSPSESVLSNRQESSTRSRKRTSAIPMFPEQDGRGIPVQRESRGWRKAITPAETMSDADSRSMDHSGQGNGISRKSSDQENVSSHSIDSTASDTRSVRKPLNSSIGHVHKQRSRRTSNDLEDSRKLHHSIDLNASEGTDECQTDPMDEQQEIDSIMESEGFSMISVSSLPSTQQYLSSARRSDLGADEQTSVYHNDESIFFDDGSLLVDEEIPREAQDISRQTETSSKQSHRDPVNSSSMHMIHSSPPYYAPPNPSNISVNEQTPTAALSSPSLPPPLKTAIQRQAPRSLGTVTTGTPKLSRVVHAGIALQGVLVPSKPSPRSQSHDDSTSGSRFLIESPEERLDNLFHGFGAGTRRELRAGLRLGEELAKRQIPSETTPKDDFAAEDYSSPTAAQPLYPQLEIPDSKATNQVSLEASIKDFHYSRLSNDQLPSPERSVIDAEDRMSLTSGTPRQHQQQQTIKCPQSETHSGQTFIVDASLMARESDWQREREAISRQIQMANTSQVIVINSDSEEDTDGEDDLDGDIWQEEARSSSHIQAQTSESLDLPTQEAAIKPKRSKLPSPWRCHSDITYDDKPLPDDAGLFWQPDLRHAQIAKQREERRAQKQKTLNTSTASASNTSTSDSKIDEIVNATTTADSQSLKPTQVAPSEKSVKQDQLEDEPETYTRQQVISNPEMSKFNHSFGDYRTKKISETGDQPRSLRTHGVTPFEHNLNSHSHTNAIFGVSTEAEHDAQKNQNAQYHLESTVPGNSSCFKNAAFQNLPTITSQPPPTVDRPSTSWFSRLSNFLTPAPAPIAPTPAIVKSLSYRPRRHGSSSSTEHLSPYQPFDIPHYRALLPIYHETRLNHPIHPFNPNSASAELLGRTIYSHGFSKDVEAWELGVVDAFMMVLADLRDKPGFQEKKDGGLIDEGEVGKRIFSLHVGMVVRGECAFAGRDMPEEWKGRLERGEWMKKGERVL